MPNDIRNRKENGLRNEEKAETGPHKNKIQA